MKSGWKTTEFWMALGALLLMNSGMPMVSPEVATEAVSQTAAYGTAFVGGMYGIGRSVAKMWNK